MNTGALHRARLEGLPADDEDSLAGSNCEYFVLVEGAISTQSVKVRGRTSPQQDWNRRCYMLSMRRCVVHLCRLQPQTTQTLGIDEAVDYILLR